MNKKVTSTDVARAAGVSRATVSYVLNHVEGVPFKETTKEKVLESAKRLGYFPNNTAQALKTNKSMSVGLVTRRKIDEHRFVQIAGAIQPMLAKAGYNVLFCSDEKGKDGFYEYYRLYKTKKVDGLIFIAHQELMRFEALEERIELIQKDQIPSVFVDYHLEQPQLNSVDIDYFNGAYKITQKLIKKGHSTIAFLYPGVTSEQESQRIKGVQKAVDEAEQVKLVVVELNTSEFDFQKTVHKLVMDDGVSAIIAAWVHIGFKVLYEANVLGIKIPDQLAVAALASNGFETLCYPKLSTTDLPLHEVGEIAAQMLLDAMERKSVRNIKIDCNVVERESS